MGLYWMPASKAASSTLAWEVSKRIKCHIELEDTDPRLAEDAEKPVLGHLGDKGADLVGRQFARLGYPRHLEFGSSRRDIGWRPLAEVVTKIDRQQRRQVLRFELLRIILDAVDQRPAGRPTIRPSRVPALYGAGTVFVESFGSVSAISTT